MFILLASKSNCVKEQNNSSLNYIFTVEASSRSNVRFASSGKSLVRSEAGGIRFITNIMSLLKAILVYFFNRFKGTSNQFHFHIFWGPCLELAMHK